MGKSKRLRTSSLEIILKEDNSDFFDGLPDDLVVSILCKLSSSASRPSDFLSILLACKRLNRLGLHHMVLSKAAPEAFAVQPKNWSDAAHRFIKKCVNAGNTEACYTLGMIRFYCLENRGSGASLMARAAKSHTQALYSLAVIQFNGSSGSKRDKDLRAGVALCARAAYLGHIDALRELGHCLQDGYGARQNVTEGRRLLVEANARELASYIRPLLTKKTRPPKPHQHHQHGCLKGSGCPLLSDFGCDLPARAVHPANRFLKEWFESGPGVLGQGLRLCSYGGCGRPETRPQEFRRCSVCGAVNYCSRGCQALDWKIRHKVECVPNEEWGGGNGVGGMVDMEDAEPVNVIME
ncbi:F-box protein [Tripterygium wilfordii]|uniref:F-box protein n=1 Tax=Tripterygium wilfordii TaxID=458696 RepID=A0A7J7DBF4_TRIWF|nr:F-box protein At5g50450-like [Tripterygium wilfordii]KAF5743692.1 F-box protein [Tripterygium wilfordii]